MQRTDEQLSQIYRSNMATTERGLRAVYEAGQGHEEWVVQQRHLEEDRRVAAEHARVDAERQAAEADAKVPAEVKKAQAEQDALDKKRAEELAAVAKERSELAEKQRIEDEKRANERVAAAAKEAAAKKHKPTKAEIDAVRADAAKRGKAEGLSADKIAVLQDEAEAELVAKAVA